MNKLVFIAALCLITPTQAWTQVKLNLAALSGKSDTIHLVGKDSSQQLVISAFEDTVIKDVTRECKIISQPEGLVKCTATGLITPLKNGSGNLVISSKGADATTISFQVSQLEIEQPLNFSNEIIPYLTQAHCNSGGCHGKQGGQNGFRLSLLGYESIQDFNYIVNENRGRRVSPAAPEQSLLLQKATGEIPHSGGVRWEVGSRPYEAVKRWIAQGMPFDPNAEKKVEHIELYPTGRTYSPNSHQQIVVTAVYNDGSKKDITHIAQYEVNQEEMAEVNGGGFVSFKNRWGAASVLVRFKEHVAIFIGNITLGESTETPLSENFIDQFIFKKLTLLGLPQSEVCDDATFYRRVSIDISGRLPKVEDVKAFLSSKDKHKRAIVIDKLLNESDYAHNFANKWITLLRNQRSRYDGARATFAFYDWIFNAMNQNMRYDQFVKKIITASGESSVNPAVIWYRSFKTDTDFIVEEKQKSEDFAQIFLGVRITCAQCHHHPFDQWNQKDYAGLTSFFTGLKIKSDVAKDELVLVKEKKISSFKNTPPTLLGGAEIVNHKLKDPRFELAKWVQQPDNPYLSRSLVNRYWKQFFGRGLIDPIDDMRKTNPPSHPELLDELSKYFVKNNFDLKSLIRLICNSKTYQLSSDPNQFNLSDHQNYSRYIPKRLTAEMFLDSINDITETKDSFSKQEMQNTRVIQLPDNLYTSEIKFLQTFGRPEMDSASDSSRKEEATVSQSLAMINSNEIHKRISSPSGLASRISTSNEDISSTIEQLFLSAFSRYPNEQEKSLAANHVQTKINDAKEDSKLKIAHKKEAIEDILWALINTKEFMFNH